MAKSPDWKVYDSEGNYEAACKHVEAAAAMVSFLGEGATIRHGHRLVVWTEGADGRAADSYDNTADVAFQRVNERSNGRK